MSTRQATLLLDGLGFGEGLRWHDDRLWFSDFYAHKVQSLAMAGDVRLEAELDERPSGLGWLPDGRLLVVAMDSRRVLRREPSGELVLHADLSPVATSHANDMVVSPGRHRLHRELRRRRRRRRAPPHGPARDRPSGWDA